MSLRASLDDAASLVNEMLDTILPQEVKGRIGENRLSRAMRYSTLAPGKRLRPFLLIAAADMFGVNKESAVQAAAAIECIHCYSLVHDDLPAMDNDDMRRGQPSCHVQFDEATAILAGDALLTYAFEVLADVSTHPDAIVRCELLQSVAKAVGVRGMIGGQMIDMLSEERELNIEQITRMQRMKTGALFAVSCDAGAILGKASPNLRNSLRAYANDLGLVFQITDDLLDAEAGKASGRVDKSSHKGTFVSVLGVDKARSQAQILAQQATQHLKAFGPRADTLCELVQYVLHRGH